ncbi:hypothetical protein P8452_09535 [Trifolium repens]|nr:hypothetical protein P8452_09535 [Trifolium repens]
MKHTLSFLDRTLMNHESMLDPSIICNINGTTNLSRISFSLKLESQTSTERRRIWTLMKNGFKTKPAFVMMGPFSMQSEENRAVARHCSIVIQPRIFAECITLVDTQVTSTEYEGHKGGRIAIGRLEAGVLEKGMEVKVCTSEDSCRYARVSELYVYEKFFRVHAEGVEAGYICAQLHIYNSDWTIADKVTGKALPSTKVEEPTVKMAFSINTSPFVGREGKYVTSRK